MSRLFKTLSFLSLLLFLAVTALWMLSFSVPMARKLTFRSVRWELSIRSGKPTFSNEPQRATELRMHAKRANEQLPALRAQLRQIESGSSTAIDEVLQELRETGASDGPAAQKLRAARQKEANKLAEIYRPPPPPALTPAAAYSFELILLALPLAILPALRLRWSARIGDRITAGLCPSCNYDLRATPQGARCPECGHSPQSKIETPKSKI